MRLHEVVKVKTCKIDYGLHKILWDSRRSTCNHLRFMNRKREYIVITYRLYKDSVEWDYTQIHIIHKKFADLQICLYYIYWYC